MEVARYLIKNIDEGLEQIAEIHRDLEDIDVGELKRYIKKLSRISESMAIGDCVIAISARINILFLQTQAVACFCA